MTDMVDISGLDKAEVLAALHNSTLPLGMGFLHATEEDMTVEQAKAFIDSGNDDLFPRREKYYFDYVQGRPLKVDLSGDSFDPWGYDRDAGKGAAKRVIAKLRSDG